MPVANATRITVQADPLIQVYSDREVLRCSRCTPPGSEPWCEHLAKVVTDNKDGEEGMVYDLSNVLIPMFPTHGLFTLASLDPNEKAGGRKIFVNQPNEPQPQFIGFLMPGEGRKVIRAMLIDWAIPNYNPATTQCNSRIHSAPAERYLQRCLEAQKGSLGYAQKWCIITEKLCLMCHDKMNNFDPADVPEL